mmetsp:Transcript_34280/g.134433  ORF Transcript_34280/g.134433 Transcript_34280/m.134433 type:complete len:147 (-) Transcript_34280:2333-2773(-)
MEHDVRVCAVQFNPVLFEPERNMEKAEELLFSRVKPSSVDFVVFPEMAFTGYEFRSKQEVLPYCEQQRGRTYNFCSSISKRLEACVVAGYPERCVGADGENVLYNSMCIVVSRVPESSFDLWLKAVSLGLLKTCVCCEKSRTSMEI